MPSPCAAALSQSTTAGGEFGSGCNASRTTHRAPGSTVNWRTLPLSLSLMVSFADWHALAAFRKHSVAGRIVVGSSARGGLPLTESDPQSILVPEVAVS